MELTALASQLGHAATSKATWSALGLYAIPTGAIRSPRASRSIFAAHAIVATMISACGPVRSHVPGESLSPYVPAAAESWVRPNPRERLPTGRYGL